MKLIFRGVKYEKEPIAVNIIEGDVGGKYRGSCWKAHHYKERYRRRQSSSELTYRGAHYQR